MAKAVLAAELFCTKLIKKLVKLSTELCKRDTTPAGIQVPILAEGGLGGFQFSCIPGFWFRAAACKICEGLVYIRKITGTTAHIQGITLQS